MQGFSNILIPRTAKWQLYIFEVGDSSHMTWLESDSSRKFKDLWLAWLNKENDLTWDPVTWDMTFMTRQDLTL